ncbi:hypothetical protein C8R45DRAFT_1025425 [Mycena sanguinolenta]|nr:hypothetical protein C8R45DRAFT_1025425 [Mycena sanguinolenta]
MARYTLLISHITLGQAATVINVLIGFLHYTLALAIVTLLIYFLPSANSAVAWNVIGRKLHSSLWPTLLRADKMRGSGFRVALFSYLSLLTTLLVTVSGVVMPLGLSAGPDLRAHWKTSSASFVADTSPLGLATSRRDNYFYGRICGSEGPVECPGGTINTATIPGDIVSKFNSTPYGAFGMQFRRYYSGTEGGSIPMLFPQFATTESLILRDGIFAVNGLIVDLDNPGVGLWNHTLPVGTSRGATWSEDVLWIQPVSFCVDTNLTIDYTLEDNSITPNQINNYNLVDHGAFYDIPGTFPTFDRNGQNLDLKAHANKGAVMSNFYTMIKLGILPTDSYEGRAFPLNWTQTNFFAGSTQSINMLYLGTTVFDGFTATGGDIQTECTGYGGQDTANITNVAIHCSMFLGPPQRTDGGDPLLLEDGSTWSQRMFTCASGTAARMQTIDFAFNGTMDLSALTISRSDIDTPVVWATEATNMGIQDVDLFWGIVPDSLEDDPTLQTIRNDYFFLPAGGTDLAAAGATLGGMPSVLPAMAWNAITDDTSNAQLVDYSGVSNYALLQKFQQLMLDDSTTGAAQIQKLIFTDMIANTMVGTDSSTTLLVQDNVEAIAYDVRYAIPVLLLLLFWLPTFAISAFVLATGLLKVSNLRFLLTHTGPGRIVVGDSALWPATHGPGFNPGYLPPSTPMDSTAVARDEVHWAKEGGRRLVCVSGNPLDKGGVATDPSPSP